MTVNFLGTATSTGVPVPTCDCPRCLSSDLHDKRLRTSVLIQDQETTVLIDTGPDVRYQLLRENVRNLDAILYTHHHFDHVAGIDDIKLYTKHKALPIFGNEKTLNSLVETHPYHFDRSSLTTGSAIANLDPKIILPYESFKVGSLEILPLPIIHGNLEPFGYRIGSFSYLLDCKTIPDESLKHLANLDVLVLTGLRPHRDHKNHLTFEQAVAYAKQLKPKLTLLSHMSDEIGHAEGNAYLRSLTDQKVEMAYDGLILELVGSGKIKRSHSSWLDAKLAF